MGKREVERPDGTRRCAKCTQWLPKDVFKKYVDPRYSAGVRISSYCNVCRPLQVKKWQSSNKDKVRVAHAAWRQRSVAEGGDRALRFYFARQMSGYRHRSREIGIPCDLSPEDLVGLYHAQDGKCYYTGHELQWANFGKKTCTPNSMSLDRLEPSKGYVKGNVVLCSLHVNAAKGTLNEDAFYAFCQRVLTVGAERRVIQ